MSETNQIFSAFAQKAAQRLDDKKVMKKARLYIPSLDEEITIRGLNRKEVLECMSLEDTDDDPDCSDNYSIYLSVVEPNLKEIAKELKDAGKIIEYMEVCNIFEMHERNSIAQEILKLSGVVGDKRVAVVSELKNS